MALALLLQQRNGKNCKPSKLDNFGYQFTATFVLESSTVKPYGRLSGQLIIESPATIYHYGIRVQYEALCTLKFESKLDNRVSYHKKHGNILEGSEDKESVDGYLESPVMIDLEPFIKDDPNNESRPHVLQSGTNTYGFNITIPGDMLPAPYKNSYGMLVYKLAAYMRSDSGINVQIGEKVLKFGGYHNLSQNIDAFKPATIERSVKRSMFTVKKLVIATLKLESCGYLPDEVVRFTMHVHNPKCLPFKMHVLLLQKATYNVDGTKKTTVAVIGNADREVAEPDLETVWEGSLKVHKAASPTYVGGSSMYSVSHMIQFKVKLDDYNVLKADQTVFIGTTREPVGSLIAAVQSMNMDNVENRSTERRGSTSSIRSDCSVTTTVSRPPTYSQLSSRMPSIETLPPGYEDVWKEDAEEYDTIPENSALEDSNSNIAGESQEKTEKN